MRRQLRGGRSVRNSHFGLENLESRTLMSVAADAINPLPAEFGDVVGVPANKTLTLPITAESADALTYSVSAPAGWKVTVRNASVSTFISFHVRYGAAQTEGDIVIQLFDDIAPNTVSVIEDFVVAGKYDNTPFQRIIDDFIVQGGDFGDGVDPATIGDGEDDTGLNFSDEFDTSAIFSGNGQLAMVNAGKDTNGSQFFLTYWDPTHEGATAPRYLDFNYTIFGQVVRGMDVLHAINTVPKETPANPDDESSVPVDAVTLVSASIVTNQTDATITLKAPAGVSRTVPITVTATDETGGTATRVLYAKSALTPPIYMNGVLTPVKAPPILGNISNQYAAPGNPITFKLSSLDIDGGAVRYAVWAAAEPNNDAPAGVQFYASGSTFTIFPPDNAYTGTFHLMVGVAQIGGSPVHALPRGTTDNPWDTQIIELTWTTDDTAPTVTDNTVPPALYANAGGSTSFTVTYTSDKQISVSSIYRNSSAIVVTGPKGTWSTARYVSMVVSDNGKSATVTYRIVAPGGYWNAPDAGTYTISLRSNQVYDAVGNTVDAVDLGSFTYSPISIFNETWYLAQHPDVAAAVAAFTYGSGYEHFMKVGQFTGLSPSIYYSDSYYFAANPDAEAAVLAGKYASGYMHFVKVGMALGLAASDNFNEAAYRAAHPEVLALIAQRKYSSALDYCIRTGIA